jgi:hypothetical protein
MVINKTIYSTIKIALDKAIHRALKLLLIMLREKLSKEILFIWVLIRL